MGSGQFEHKLALNAPHKYPEKLTLIAVETLIVSFRTTVYEQCQINNNKYELLYCYAQNYNLFNQNFNKRN